MRGMKVRIAARTSLTQPGSGGQRFRNTWNLEHIDVNAGVDVPLRRHAILPFAVVAHGSIEAEPRIFKSTISNGKEETKMTITNDAIIEAIETAQNKWDGADWTHAKTDEDDCIVTDDSKDADEDATIYCEGNDNECKTCQDVERHAEAASECGNAAIAAIRRGDMAEARTQIERASEIESEYGDDPAWGPVLRLIEEATAKSTVTTNIRGREVEMAYTAEIADLVAAIERAAGVNQDGVIQASDMVALFPGNPAMHTTTLESTALLAAGCVLVED